MESDYFTWSDHRILVDLGPVEIGWYGVLFALGFLVGYQIVAGMFKRFGYPRKDLDALLLTMMISTVIGARLGHCLFYDPAYYLSNPLQIFAIWKGGLASHGGAIGIVIGLYIYSKRRPHLPMLRVLDMVAVPTALAGAFIRTGNFFNSEILGHPSEMPWAIIFLAYDAIPRHPAQLYEATAYLITFVILYTVYTKTHLITRKGVLLGLFLVLIFSARIGLEIFKLEQANFDVPLGLSMGQLLSIPAVAAGVVLLAKGLSGSAGTTSPTNQ